jgi:hypothetical protein
MRLHVEALFTHDEWGRLVSVNEPNGAIAPRVFVGQTIDGPIVRVRSDIDEPIRRELERAATSLSAAPRPPLEAIDPEPLQTILNAIEPVENIWVGPAFAFPNDLAPTAVAVRVNAENAEFLRPLFRGWIDDVSICQPMMAVVIDDHAVALCCSVRRTEEAHEAGVETAASMRGRGYAAAAVTSWANAVRADGRVPLYSTSWQNEASRSVARKLHLVPFGSDLHIT